jgi:hypothetical protein
MVLRLKDPTRFHTKPELRYLPIRVGKSPFEALSLAQGMSRSLSDENSKQMFLVGLPVFALA